jgi:hypothetical protein
MPSMQSAPQRTTAPAAMSSRSSASSRRG